MVYQYEFEVLVNRYNKILIYMRYKHNNALRFLGYSNTLENAVGYCADHPTTIIVQGR